MIDLIKCTKSKLTSYEIAMLIEKNKLSNNSEAGQPCYSNKKTKNLKNGNGVFINIDTNGNLKIEFNLHKYHNDITGQGLHNYNLFTMPQAKETAENLFCQKGLNPSGAKVRYYEIGINLELPQDCIIYLQKIKYIQLKTGKRKRFYINPRFKDERVITTEFHDNIRVNYKAYDKGMEVKTKKGKDLNTHLLRIEVVNKRVEKTPVYTFFSKPNLMRLQESFFRDWENVEFEPQIHYPPGTTPAKKDLIKRILTAGPDQTLKAAKEDAQKGILTDKGYRRVREFICRDWEELRTRIILTQSPEELEYREELNRLKILVHNNL